MRQRKERPSPSWGAGGGGASYNVLYEEKNIHINKKKNSKEKSDLRLADIWDGQAFLLHGI